MKTNIPAGFISVSWDVQSDGLDVSLKNTVLQVFTKENYDEFFTEMMHLTFETQNQIVATFQFSFETFSLYMSSTAAAFNENLQYKIPENGEKIWSFFQQGDVFNVVIYDINSKTDYRLKFECDNLGSMQIERVGFKSDSASKFYRLDTESCK